VLTSARGSDENSLDEPRKVAPVKSELSRPGSDFAHTFPALSLTVLRLKTGD
jgi:alpha-L-arabinofuranosidase